MSSWIAAALVGLMGAIAVVAVLLSVFGLWWAARTERRAQADLAHAQSTGAEPASLYPVVDLERCIGSGSCVTVCPEKDVLALLDGKAALVNPTACIGHGECMRACPVDAIQLVIGTERRGSEIPVVSADFETNVPGVYVVGELGGMGLVYNAMTQALQAVAAIGRKPPPKTPGVLQLLVVGAGPAGLAASLQAKKLGLVFETVDQDTLGGTVLQFPRHKLVMTRPVDLPLVGRVKFTEVRKEQLLEKWRDIVRRTGLVIRSEVRVEGVTRGPDGVFEVNTTAGPIRTHRVVLAIGRRGTPRKLGIEGEDLGKVTYRLLEPERYAGTRCLVVGGGDAAVEAAVALGEAGAKVSLSYRGKVFDRIKKKNQHRLDRAVAANQVQLLLASRPVAIGEREVILETEPAQRTAMLNDYVLIFAGGVLPTAFLEAAGVEVQTFRGEAYAPANR
ncbi:MAG: NAD(P)-binding domain-containing protein [Myxococcota bacterium]